MATPDDRRYTDQHEWALVQGTDGTGTVVRCGHAGLVSWAVFGADREAHGLPGLRQSSVAGEAY